MKFWTIKEPDEMMRGQKLLAQILDWIPRGAFHKRDVFTAIHPQLLPLCHPDAVGDIARAGETLVGAH